MKKVAIVGIQGVPAKYGGFESLVENIIGDNCSPDIQYTVFCSGKDYKTHLKSYKGARLKYISAFRANGIQSVPYDILSMIKCVRGYDDIVILGVSGCIFLPILRLLYHKRLIINIDGLEHKRDKWGKMAKKFLRFSEAMAVRYANVVIADNKGIQDYVKETYKKDSSLVAYGGDHAQRNLSEEQQIQLISKYGIVAGNYAVSLCRIEPENNSNLICDAFSESGKVLVFVGNWNHNEYGRSLKKKYESYRNIKMIDAVYDLDELYALRNQCSCYIHGHSAGGTNPSLVEAMFFGKPILTYDVVYNRETTENKAYYFKSKEQLIELLHRKNKNGDNMREIAERRYVWKLVAKQYEALY